MATEPLIALDPGLAGDVVAAGRGGAVARRARSSRWRRSTSAACRRGCGRTRRRTCALLIQLARAHGDRLFTIYEDERVSYRGARTARSRTSRRELREMGVAKGDRVALAMRNLPEWPVVFFAATSHRRDRGAAQRVVDRRRARIRHATIRARSCCSSMASGMQRLQPMLRRAARRSSACSSRARATPLGGKATRAGGC